MTSILMLGNGGREHAMALSIKRDKSISLIDKQMASQGIKIFKKYGTILPQVKISIDQIQQVFFNFLLNAFDAMIGNGILTIYTKLSADGKNIQVIFEDNGTGIPASEFDKIFEPFFTTKSPDKGTGLGLSIAKGIVQMHGGRMWVESELGKGAKFILYVWIQRLAPKLIKLVPL